MTHTTTATASFRSGPGDMARDWRAVAEVVSNQYAGGQWIDEIGQKYLRECHYDWDVTRLIWDGDKLIHHWGVWGYPMRVGPITLKTAGIGAVVTLEDYRKRGLMHRAATESFEAMHAHDYDVTVLRGRHYAKFGYVRAWNYVTTKVKPDELPTADTPPDTQPLGPAHLDAIHALYNRDYAPYTGTCVRPTYPMIEDGEMNAHGWFDADGNLLGYVRAVPTDEGKTLSCFEATGDPQIGLAVLLDQFKQGAYEMLHLFTLPHAHSLLAIFRRGACIVEHQYFYHTGWQVRIVNFARILSKLRRVFETRVQESRFADWTGSLHLDAGDHTATLVLDAGQVHITDDAPGAHVLRGGPHIGSLLIGSDDPDEVIRQAQIACEGDAAALARVLFPNLYPVMSHWDEY
ncbi:MAG: GNAT family N-acetyltransferase [Anaerolineae bacterium]|nr:GNAT family N-acetyltransferase [Anaerolineae bacterium]